MITRKNIFAIIGSASQQSSNHTLVNNFVQQTLNDFNVTIYKNLRLLPHFDPEISARNPPHLIVELRKHIQQADGILICTPEYVFSIPSGLKNAIEWCVATTVFTGKPVAIITASAHGQKGHEELLLIMKTLMAKFTNETTLLIQGIRGKVNDSGEITDSETITKLKGLIESFKQISSG